MWWSPIRGGQERTKVALPLCLFLCASWVCAQSETKKTFTRGSEERLVIDAMGRPDKVKEIRGYGDVVWTYGKSEVVIRKKLVAGWKNAGNLSVRMGNADPNADLVAKGSNESAVVRAFGTPDTLEAVDTQGREIWRWGSSSITIRKGLVEAWQDQGQLKAKLKPPTTG